MADVDKEWADLLKSVVSKPEISARGALQGATSGWGDEAAARVDQGISKIPVLRSVLPQDERFPPLTDPNVTYEQRRDAYRDANRTAQQADPKRFGAYEVGGALLQQAVLANTPLAPLVMTSGPRTGAASGGLQGFIAGTGASEGRDVGEVLKDGGKGLATGAFFGGLGGFLGNEVPKGTPPATELQKLGGMATGALKKEIAERRDAIGAVAKTFPQVSKAFGDPEKVLAATAQPKAELMAKRDALYAAADGAASRGSAVPMAVDEVLDKTAAIPNTPMSEMVPRASGGVDPSLGASGRASLPDDTASLAQTQRIDTRTATPPMTPAAPPEAPPEAPGGGMPTVHAMDKVKALEGLAASARGPGGVEAPAVKKIADQFYAMTGGSDVVPSVQVRKFMTDYLGPDHLPSAQTSTEIAKREVYNILRDELHGHVAAQIGPAKMAELEKVNQLLSGLKSVEDIAKAAQNKALTTPPKAAASLGEKEKIGEYFKGAPVAGGAARTIAGGMSQLSPALARPVIDKVAGQHRETLETIAGAAKAGDRDTVTKTLMQQIFGD